MDDINNILNDIKKSALSNLFYRDYDSAIDDLKKAEVLDQQNPEILFNLGIAYSRKGLYKTANDYFTKVLNLNISYINSANVKKNIAFCFIQSKDYDKALNILDEVINDFSADIQALNMKGYCLEKKGRIRDALKTYREIFNHDRSNINSLNSSSYLMALLGIELESALKIAKFVYNKDKTNPAYNDTLGYAHMKLGNYAEAEKYLNAAAYLLPFNEEINEHIRELDRLKSEL